MPGGSGLAETTSPREHQAWTCVTRFTILFALIGLLLGLGEAAWLYFSPRWPLLRPDVGHVIWFVAPLTDLCFAALLGLTLGLVLAERQLQGLSRHVAGLTAAFLSAVMLWVVGTVGIEALQAWRGGIELRNVPLWSLVAFAALLIACCFRHERILSLIENGSLLHFRRAVGMLLVSVTILVCGLLADTINRSIPPATVSANADLPRGRPNIVLITLDTARADHLSLYGYARPTAPNLERWARQGVVFENAIAPSSWTLPSHVSIMTGLLPHQHGADWRSPVRGIPWTLPAILGSKGYETAGFSTNLYYGYAGWGLDRGFAMYDDDSSSIRHNLTLTLAGQNLIQPSYYLWVHPDRLDRRSAKQVNQDIFRWFQHKPANPFFLFVNYFDAHEPFIAPAPYDRRFGHASDELIDKVTEQTEGRGSGQNFSDAERQSLIASYDNCLASLDNELNGLLKFLSGQPEWSNTFVIVTADHGEALGEHQSYGHGLNLYREALHVPLVVLGPGVPAGLRIEPVVGTRRLFATILDLTMRGQEPFARHSLSALWTLDQKAYGSRGALISELLTRTTPHENYLSLFGPQWHYLEDSSGHRELYDWRRDPAERINLADQHTAIAAELANRLRAYAANSIRPWEGPDYLAALGPDAYSVVPVANGADLDDPDPIGICQAIFPREGVPAEPREDPNEDLLRSLPYN